MKKSLLLGISLAIVFVLAIVLAACSAKTSSSSTLTSPVPGAGFSGPSGMMGSGGMMNQGKIGTYSSGAQRISLDRAQQIANGFLQSRPDLKFQVGEVMEFQYNFYVDFIEQGTGIHAVEALIDPYTGDMYPEPGPSVMWNTKSGMMSGVIWGVNTATAPMTVTESQAQANAEDFLNGYLTGSKPGPVERFYGYYTLNIVKDGQIYGMLSVNGYTGQVWYHAWHGQFLGIK